MRRRGVRRKKDLTDSKLGSEDSWWKALLVFASSGKEGGSLYF